MTNGALSVPALSDDLWNAVTARRYVSAVYAVRSTGIYCRTDCPSRRPDRGFPNPSQLQLAAGIHNLQD